MDRKPGESFGPGTNLRRWNSINLSREGNYQTALPVKVIALGSLGQGAQGEC